MLTKLFDKQFHTFLHDSIIIGARKYSKTQRSLLGYFPLHLPWKMYCDVEGQIWMKQFHDQKCDAMLQVPSGEYFSLEEQSHNWTMQDISITKNF
jgi:hypothetical protein